MFLGDQGRDALITARMMKNKDPVFIGPVTSVGNMYLGPFYYYFMLPFLWLSYPSPLGPVYAVAIFNTAVVFLIYLIGKKMFDPLTGLLSSFFLAFSAAAIDISRFSWNPNLAPLISLLMVFFTWKALKKPKFWLLVSICFSLLIQLHYMTLLAGVSAGIVWLYSLIANIRRKNPKFTQNFFKQSLLCLIVFALSFTPLILFDIKHQGINLRAFQQILFQEETFAAADSPGFIQRMGEVLQNIEGRSRNILFEINLGKNKLIYQGMTFSSLVILAGFFWHKLKNKKNIDALLVLTSFLVIGILGTAAYQHSIFIHYIAYLFPVTALVYGVILSKLVKTKWLAVIPLLFSGLFLNYNLRNLPIESNYLYQRTKAAAEKIYPYLKEGETYDIILLSETKDLYGQSYRYFLSTTDKPPIYKDRDHPLPQALVIIDEEKKVEDVTALPIYEIVMHSDKEIDQKIIGQGLKVNQNITNQELPDVYILREN